ncbi:DUF4233 domain-containing protein [Georgenia sp. AZ-5]|uniref:DUF4233 domain-containing protein n=1 Tax=Georgenia sp. AZ-5 TaxID=3367526 RepID=UPI0037550FCB
MSNPSPAVPGPPRPPGSARRQFAATVLVSEVLIVLFASLAAFALDLAAPAQVWGVGAVVMVACAVAAGLLRTRAGYVIGSAVQLLLLAAGFVLAMMFVVGLIFTVLWVVSLQVGGRIDAERRERHAAEVEHYRTHGAS